MKLKSFLCMGAALALTCSCSNGEKQQEEYTPNQLRAPMYPLVSIDPYTSGWSSTDCLYDSPVKHWTGENFPLLGAVKVDGEVYRFMGNEELEFDPVCGTSEQEEWMGKYTVRQPAKNWNQTDFDDSTWKSAPGAFGTTDTEPTAKTHWGEEFIWVRRWIDIKEDLSGKNLYVAYSHDDDVEIYINGIEVVSTRHVAQKRQYVKLPDAVVATLKPGKNLMAAYCHNRIGNGFLDFGIVAEKENARSFTRVAQQTGVDMQATQTFYQFVCGPVNLNIKFTAPLLMEDLDLMTRPVNYLSYETSSNDGKSHDVSLYFEAAHNWAVDQPFQKSVSTSGTKEGIVYASTGSMEQNILAKKGDDLRIDWGYFYLASPEEEQTSVATGDGVELRKRFLSSKELKAEPTDGYDKLALACNLGKEKEASGYIMLAYDDIYSIQYFGQNLRPYWNRKGNETIFSQMKKAVSEYDELMSRCRTFDIQLMKDAEKVGGREYAELCALAYRQVMAAHKLVESPEGELLYLSKENFSNGCINTVDLTYPSAPLYLVYNPDLQKGMMNGIFYYSESGKWNKPFAAHDLGTYPQANGQVYEGDMPVEESGNMLILAAAIAEVEGNANYAEKHWDVLTVWANYLVEKGLDPENQLCTDDFAGHFAHNANLSIKAILGVASYGKLAGMLGKAEVAEVYLNKAKEMASEWVKMADDGDHYRLTFDKPGTWSQKYNLIWDELLCLNIFPKEVVEKEIAYYLTKQNPYGLPLDSRETYTKNDWIMWTAAMSSDLETFKKFVSPIYRFMNETTNRVPMSDWTWTLEPKQRGFQARSVIGGYWMQVLKDKLNKR